MIWLIFMWVYLFVKLKHKNFYSLKISIWERVKYAIFASKNRFAWRVVLSWELKKYKYNKLKKIM